MLALSSTEFSSLVARLKKNTSNFLDGVDSINAKVTSIDDSMLSIRKSTQKFSEQKNIFEKVTGDIEKVSYYLSTASIIRPIVENELKQNKPILKQQVLFDSLNRLADAGQFLVKYKSKVASAGFEYELVDRLFQDVVKICLDAFQDAIKIVKASHDIHVFENDSVEAMLRFAKDIALNLYANGIDQHYHIYEKTRLEVLAATNSSNNNNSSASKHTSGRDTISATGKAANSSNNPISFLKSQDKQSSFSSLSPSKRFFGLTSSSTATTNTTANTNTNMNTNSNAALRPSLAVLDRQSSSSATSFFNTPPWENLLADLPYHRGENPFQSICDDCIATLKRENALWNLVFSSTINNANATTSDSIENDYGHNSNSRNGGSNISSVEKAVRSYCMIAAKVIKSLPSSFPSILTEEFMIDTNSATSAASTSTINNNNRPISTSAPGSSSTTTNGSTYSLLRHVNIMLCNLDIIDIFLTNWDDFREILFKGTSGIMMSGSSDESGGRGVKKLSLLTPAIVDDNNNSSNNELISYTALIDMRNFFIKNYSKSITHLLRLKWDSDVSTSGSSGHNSLTSSLLLPTSSTLGIRATMSLLTDNATGNNHNNNSNNNANNRLSGSDGRNTHSSHNSASAAAAALTCDVNPMTVAIVHCCKVLSSFSDAFYEDQLMVLVREIIQQQQQQQSINNNANNNKTISNNNVHTKKSTSNNSTAVTTTNTTTTMINIPTNATTIRQLTLTLLQILIRHLEKLGTKLNPCEGTKKNRSLETGHAKYTVGDNEAINCLKWAQKQLFLVNNYFSMLTFLTENKNTDQFNNNSPINNNNKITLNTNTTSNSNIHNSDSNKNSNNSTNTTAKRNNSTTNILHEEETDRLATEVGNKLMTTRTEFCEMVMATLAVSQEDMLAFDTQYHRESSTAGKHKVLKAKFSLFNSGMNALENMKGEWRLVSPLLREGLTNDFIQNIATVYSAFYKKYSVIEFSKKHMNEYLVYLPTQVERFLLNFFDISSS